MNKNFIGALLVSMAATAALAADAPAAAAAPADAKKIEHLCQNDTCKGKADCKGYGNEGCKGQNSCKGKGHVAAATAEACKKAKGKWTVTKK